jgi:hypothetical protein
MKKSEPLYETIHYFLAAEIAHTLEAMHGDCVFTVEKVTTPGIAAESWAIIRHKSIRRRPIGKRELNQWKAEANANVAVPSVRLQAR